jgi:hypothetical protein
MLTSSPLPDLLNQSDPATRANCSKSGKVDMNPINKSEKGKEESRDPRKVLQKLQRF